MRRLGRLLALATSLAGVASEEQPAPCAEYAAMQLLRGPDGPDPKLLAMLDQYKPKLREWFDKKVADDSDGSKMGQVSDKLGYDEWLRAPLLPERAPAGNVKCREM